jgi:CSLREA domain-containing protein
VLVAAALAVACIAAWPAAAAAETFSVTTTADEADAAVGDGCLTAGGKCSLRAAIEEANATPAESDEIRFEEEVFEGDADSVIALGSALPTIVSPLTLAGRECPTEAGVVGPCAEIEGEPDEPGLEVEGARNVQIELVAVTGAEVGVELREAEEFWVLRNWLGTSLDGSATGNDIGIKVEPGSDTSRVGGEGPGAGNLIANSGTVGLEIRGSSNVRVIGNQFGVTPTGVEAASNASDIAISSTASSVALENSIGTRVSPEASATSACDGGCNLISGSGGSGIDLSGSDGSGPPVGTTVAGNLVGFDSTGDGSVPNGGAGIYIGSAPRTVVGGPKPGDANRFAGGPVAVEAGPGAPGLTVRGNLIGRRAGAAVPPPSNAGIVVDSTGLFLPAQESSILGNEIGLEGGIGISQRGLGGQIAGNLVEGGAIGIRVAGSENSVVGNRLEAPDEYGILLEEGLNAIVGNEIDAAGKAGVRIQGGGLFGVSGNLVGGDTAASENRIDDSAGAAIEISDVKASRNEVGRNRGAGNGGLFIDLVAAPPDAENTDPGDPNEEIQPPPIATISATGAAGFAEPEARVRVFRKASPLPGEIASFLGEAIADQEGDWSLGFPVPLPPGTAVAATQTSGGGTSEAEIAAVPLPEGGLQLPGDGGSSDRKAPRTRMLEQPRRVRAGHLARFAFTSNEPGSSFQCSLDRGKFRACSSPKKYRLRRPGKHLFRVRAIDPTGNVDLTPVRRRFQVLG